MDLDPDSLSIILYPTPTLEEKALPIVRVDETLKQLVDRMFVLMYEAKGVGLAAPQVNVPLRLFVANPTGDIEQKNEELVLINPELQFPKGSDEQQEGCLSLPGIYGDVRRPKQIKVSAYDITGQSIDRTVDGFLARVLMHETDHLDGVLFPQRMSEDKRVEITESIEKMEDDYSRSMSSESSPNEESIKAQADAWRKAYAQS